MKVLTGRGEKCGCEGDLQMDGIVAEATKLVEEKGYGNFSVRELAQCLHVKAASSYYIII